jgi:hypothetical protein
MRTSIRRLAASLLALVAALTLAGCGAAAPFLDGAAYLTAVLDQTQRAGAGISTLSGLVGSPQPTDAAWRDQVSQEVAALRAIAAEARALTPPEALAGAHQTYLDALAQLDQTLTTVEGGVSLGDSAQLQEAAPMLAEVERLLTAAQELMGPAEQ